MKIFTSLYDKVLQWSRHPHAVRYLGLVSAAEASVFPVPTAFMLAPMALADRDRAWWYALLATVTSVLGGTVGYLIGMFLFDQVGQTIIEFYHAQEKFNHLKAWFDQYGVWVVILAGFSPIPYKLFTITAGLLGMPFLPFVVASLIGRSGQFFLISGLIRWGGEQLEGSLRRWVDVIGWGTLALAVIAYFVLR